MKIGILSFAHHHAEGYIQSLKQLPGVDVMGIADQDEKRASHYASSFNVPLFHSYEDLLQAKPDGVIVTSENNHHRALVETAASYGIHVLCEKPLATTLEDGKAMLDACQKAGIVLMTAFPMRFSPPVMEVKNKLDAGDFGRVFCFNSTNQGELPKKYRRLVCR